VRALLLVALAACHYTHGSASDGDAGSSDARDPDGPRDAARDALADSTIDAAPCVPGTIVDHFNSATPCGPWGSPNMSGGAVLAEGTGRLTIVLGTGGTSHGGCTDPGANAFGAGVFVEITSVAGGTTGYTNLNAYAVSGVSGQLVIKGGLLSMATPLVSVTYDPVAMRWLRLRPTSQGVEGDYSADGVHWTVLATNTGAAPAMIKLDFGAGTDVGETLAGHATFQNLNVCP
jgi:hypothetical protein